MKENKLVQFKCPTPKAFLKFRRELDDELNRNNPLAGII